MDLEIISKKLDSIEYELNNLKSLVNEKSNGKKISLKGILKGIEFTEADIDGAKKSLFHSL